MAKSPFRNLDPEDLNTHAVINRPVIGSHAVTDLLRRAAIACCGRVRISNVEIARIANYVHLYDAPAKPRRISFTDFHSDYPAHLVLEKITDEQYNAARALLLIDEALDMVNANGWNSDATDRLLLASAWLGDANEKSADDARWRTVIEGERKALAAAARQRIKSTEAARNAALRNSSLPKARGLEICKSRKWSSRSEAKEHIAKQVNRSEGTVNNWITSWLLDNLIRPL